MECVAGEGRKKRDGRKLDQIGSGDGLRLRDDTMVLEVLSLRWSVRSSRRGARNTPSNDPGLARICLVPCHETTQNGAVDAPKKTIRPPSLLRGNAAYFMVIHLIVKQ
jgi:hypothetical protein